ncbi:hypothetical protein C2G38_2039770 [Gigaspora rosea]|uniref:Uncharacterized protein n=1 Tax=Gigaspora rosea TaxID=44941 RepID=A0A397UZY6_9GLOM|nr:hypothetical protein C2G38_2039770 [Gigaspora rosea]
MNNINYNKISSEINVEEYFEEEYADVGEPSTNIETVIIREGVNNNMNDIECNEISSNDTMDDNKINVEEYFEEVCHGNADVRELSINIVTVTIREGRSFLDFDDAEQYIRRYADFKGFKIKLGRSTMIETGDKKIMRKRTVLCRYSG